MGSKSSSQSRQSTTNNSQSAGVQGDNSGFLTVGDGNTYNITQTDGGLVSATVDIADRMFAANEAGFNSAADMTKAGFNYAENVNQDSLNFGRSVVGEFGNVVDGAFSFGRDAIAGVESIAGNSIKAQNDLAYFAVGENSNLAGDSIKAQNDLAYMSIGVNSQLAGDVAALSENMHATNTQFASNTISDTIHALDQSSARVSDIAAYSMDNNSNLARDFASGSFELASLVMDKTNDAYKDASDQTILAHKQALQFADNSTRSDGQQLALDTNKTMIYVVVGVVGLAGLAFLAKKG